MFNVAVSTNKTGEICISQDYNLGEVDEVLFHPEQADMIIKWIQEARNELLNGEQELLPENE